MLCLEWKHVFKNAVINPQNYNFKDKILMLSKGYEPTEFNRRTRLHVHSETYGPTAVILEKKLKYNMKIPRIHRFIINSILLKISQIQIKMPVATVKKYYTQRHEKAYMKIFDF